MKQIGLTYACSLAVLSSALHASSDAEATERRFWNAASAACATGVTLDIGGKHGVHRFLHANEQVIELPASFVIAIGKCKVASTLTEYTLLISAGLACLL